MESLKELYRIGAGPSSSHTIGPQRAARKFMERYPQADKYRVTLYGSLAATGKGHMTDSALIDILGEGCEIMWEPTTFLPYHPNGMKFEAFIDGKQIGEWFIYSIGGGALANEDNPRIEHHIYPMNKISDIQKWCEDKGTTYWEYVEQYEGPEIWDYLSDIWVTMKASIERGLENEGVLPGGLGLRRKAATYYLKATGYSDGAMRNRGMLYAYALAVSEENAAGGQVVTAPTCGSSGVLPAVLYRLYKGREFKEQRILRALATAGLFGNVVKTNASISGAEVGCQGEVGVACAMAAAAACQMFGGSPAQIEYSAELALEHHLGLTCDPVCGLVQIPCIERNAIAAARAFDANIYATYSDGIHSVSFDRVVNVMKDTGHDLPSLYKETSTGGLAKDYK